MESKIYLTIAISSILVFALILAIIPIITSVSAVKPEGLMGEHLGLIYKYRNKIEVMFR
ncbi:MAG TPA: hypothetical protein VFP49_10005 [Nitrososphaeraceae archaeon]|nr:hypothetical protein [Nitrososphaeraceae archaeon]